MMLRAWWLHVLVVSVLATTGRKTIKAHQQHPQQNLFGQLRVTADQNVNQATTEVERRLATTEETAATKPPGSYKDGNATYTYFIHTAHGRMDTALDEVATYIGDRLQTVFDDIGGDVTLVGMDRRSLGECDGEFDVSTYPSWYNSSFFLCSKYTTTLRAHLAITWDEEIFRRTVLNAIRLYVQDWNSADRRSSFIEFVEPFLVKAEMGLLLEGAKQLMSIYEHSFLGDVMEVAFRRRGLENENPPFTITEIEYQWQRMVPQNNNDDTNRGPMDGGGLRRSLQTAPPVVVKYNNLVQMLVMAECGTEACTDKALDTFVQATFPKVTDVLLVNLREWSETNYFDMVDSISLSTDRNATLVDEPDLPREFDYQTPGIQEHDKPIWIWLSMLIAVGIVALACIWASFCLTARDYQAARKLRQEEQRQRRREMKRQENRNNVVEQPASPRRQPPTQTPREEDDGVTELPPRSPKRVFNKKKKKKGNNNSPVEDSNNNEDNDGYNDEFDVTESDHPDPTTIKEIPKTPDLDSPTPKKKKKKKKTSSSGTTKKKKKASEAAEEEGQVS